MNQEIRLLIGFLVFYLVYIILVDITKLSSIPLFFLITIFVLFLFLPDISNENNFFNKNQKFISVILFLIAFGLFLFNKQFLVPLIIIGLTLLFILFTTKTTLFNSISTGIYMAIPLFFINPFYSLFGFLGFLSFWVSTKI